jgi:hypothetical protein
MRNRILYITWAGLYAVCAVLGLIPVNSGVGKALFLLTALIFFVPPAILVYHARTDGDRKTLRRLSLISACSLGLTLLFLIANILSAGASNRVGEALHGILALVSAPMFCSQYWLISLFLWACLLMVTLRKTREK